MSLAARATEPAGAHWSLTFPARQRVRKGGAGLSLLIIRWRCSPSLRERELGLARRASRPALLALRHLAHQLLVTLHVCRAHATHNRPKDTTSAQGAENGSKEVEKMKGCNKGCNKPREPAPRKEAEMIGA